MNGLKYNTKLNKYKLYILHRQVIVYVIVSYLAKKVNRYLIYLLIRYDFYNPINLYWFMIVCFLYDKKMILLIINYHTYSYKRMIVYVDMMTTKWSTDIL